MIYILCEQLTCDDTSYDHGRGSAERETAPPFVLSHERKDARSCGRTRSVAGPPMANIRSVLQPGRLSTGQRRLGQGGQRVGAQRPREGPHAQRRAPCPHHQRLVAPSQRPHYLHRLRGPHSGSLERRERAIPLLSH